MLNPIVKLQRRAFTISCFHTLQYISLFLSSLFIFIGYHSPEFRNYLWFTTSDAQKNLAFYCGIFALVLLILTFIGARGIKSLNIYLLLLFQTANLLSLIGTAFYGVVWLKISNPCTVAHDIVYHFDHLLAATISEDIPPPLCGVGIPFIIVTICAASDLVALSCIGFLIGEIVQEQKRNSSTWKLFDFTSVVREFMSSLHIRVQGDWRNGTFGKGGKSTKRMDEESGEGCEDENNYEEVPLLR